MHAQSGLKHVKSKHSKKQIAHKIKSKFCKFRLSVPVLRLCFPDSRSRCHFLAPMGFPGLPHPGLVRDLISYRCQF